MKIVREQGELDELRSRSAVAIGNFDGVHLAHQRLLRSVVDAARRLDAIATAVTFEPHPAAVLAPDRAPKLLTPLGVKVRLIEEQGIADGAAHLIGADNEEIVREQRQGAGEITWTQIEDPINK